MTTAEIVEMARRLRDELPDDAEMDQILPWLVKNFPKATPRHLIKVVQIMAAMDDMDTMNEATT